jgi:hypothetical protein
MFRELTRDEVTAIRLHVIRANERGELPFGDEMFPLDKKYYVDYAYQGNFTVALLKVDGNLHVGVVKRAASLDNQKPTWARWQALLRAAENRPVSLLSEKGEGIVDRLVGLVTPLQHGFPEFKEAQLMGEQR